MKWVGIPIVFFIICVLSMSVCAFSKGDYVQKVETHVDITSAYTHYRVCNPTASDYSITSSDDFSVSFVETNGDLTSYRFMIMKSVPYQVDDYTRTCENDTVKVPADPVNMTASYDRTAPTDTHAMKAHATR